MSLCVAQFVTLRMNLSGSVPQGERKEKGEQQRGGASRSGVSLWVVLEDIAGNDAKRKRQQGSQMTEKSRCVFRRDCNPIIGRLHRRFSFQFFSIIFFVKREIATLRQLFDDSLTTTTTLRQHRHELAL